MAPYMILPLSRSFCLSSHRIIALAWRLQGGRLLICSMHQPRAELLLLFNARPRGLSRPLRRHRLCGSGWTSDSTETS